MNAVRGFWPLDFDQEVEIYETLSWDLPGLKRSRKRTFGKRRVTSRQSGRR